MHLALFIFCLFIAAFVVYRWPKNRSNDRDLVQVQRVEAQDWEWPAWPEGKTQVGVRREAEADLHAEASYRALTRGIGRRAA
jgi:hypothetical protein